MSDFIEIPHAGGPQDGENFVGLIPSQTVEYFIDEQWHEYKLSEDKQVYEYTGTVER